MRAIIDGKRYDTETAKVVAEWANTYDRGDFHHYSEALYLTPKGAWFLHGEGNASSPYNDELLVEVMAARLAWMISMRIHSDKQLRAEMRAEMNSALARARLVDSAGRYRGDTAEDLWINAG